MMPTQTPTTVNVFALPSGERMSRTMDASFLNLVANHPEVRPYLGGDGVLDLQDVVGNASNLAAVTAEGGFVAVAQGFGVYEIHSMFLPEHGTAAIRAMLAATDYVFACSDAIELVTKAPRENRPAAGLARLAGFHQVFTTAIRLSAMQPSVAADFFSLPMDVWAMRSKRTKAVGAWLHQVFEDVKRERHSTLGAHSDEDDAHLHAAGAAVLMAMNGLPRKAMEYYNRWALLTGYPPILLLREQPTVLDLDGVIVELRGQDVEVLACR